MRVLEDRNRRDNLRIDGIKESHQETWDECEEKVKKILKEIMEIEEEISIERAHRTGIKQNGRSRTVVCFKKTMKNI